MGLLFPFEQETQHKNYAVTDPKEKKNFTVLGKLKSSNFEEYIRYLPQLFDQLNFSGKFLRAKYEFD